jgi:hypothetical protein
MGKLGQLLGLSPRQLDQYSAVATPGSERELALAPEVASHMTDWVHFGVLELTHLTCFRADVRWIAAVLGVSTDRVNLALHRLTQLGLLEMRADRWVDVTGNAAIHLAALEAAALQTLRHAWEELPARGFQPASTICHHEATLVAINSQRVPLAIAMLSRCRQRVLELLTEGRPDALCELRISLSPVTPIHTDLSERSTSR